MRTCPTVGDVAQVPRFYTPRTGSEQHRNSGLSYRLNIRAWHNEYPRKRCRGAGGLRFRAALEYSAFRFPSTAAAIAGQRHGVGS